MARAMRARSSSKNNHDEATRAFEVPARQRSRASVQAAAQNKSTTGRSRNWPSIEANGCLLKNIQREGMIQCVDSAAKREQAEPRTA
jgi:hypothetical protein